MTVDPKSELGIKFFLYRVGDADDADADADADAGDVVLVSGVAFL